MMAPTCSWMSGRSATLKRASEPNEKKHGKLQRRRMNSTIYFSHRKSTFKLNSIGFSIVLFLLSNSISVTIANLDSEFLKKNNLNLTNLLNETSLDGESGGSQRKDEGLTFLRSEKEEKSLVNSSLSSVLYLSGEAAFSQSNKSNAVAVVLTIAPERGQKPSLDRTQQLVPISKTLIIDGQKKRTRRKRRYVRFPPGEGGRFSGKYHSRPFHSGPPLVGAYSSGFLPWGPISRPSFYSHVPTMRPRSPRLVFRDPVEPGTLSAPSGFFGGGLQDIDFDDDREERGGKGTQAGMEDKGICLNGRCEFFLSCWMSSGLIDGSCGGFLYACCQRVDKEAPKTNEHRTNDVITLPTNFGPVVNDFRCGVSIGKIGAQRRIVGGDEAGFGSFPWQAYIRIGSSRCGGSLVNRFHVVTAGHCVARASARQVQVTLGDYVINSAIEPLPAYTFGVREIRVHPYFKFTPQADRFDVAVLRLDRPVQYMPHIAPICLPEKNEDFLGQYGWAAGWGALQAGSRLRPKTLQAVDVPVIDNRQCERWHKSNGINVVIYDEMMCAGYRNGGKDSCQGDSGGPLMMEKANRWYLIGIVSAGYSCAQRGQPGIYHRVAHTVDWISYIINS